MMPRQYRDVGAAWTPEDSEASKSASGIFRIKPPGPAGTTFVPARPRNKEVAAPLPP